jgi:hypothetical protein
VIGDVHADWPALSAVVDQVAVAGITGLGAWGCEIGAGGPIGGFVGPSAGLEAMGWGDPIPRNRGSLHALATPREPHRRSRSPRKRSGLPPRESPTPPRAPGCLFGAAVFGLRIRSRKTGAVWGLRRSKGGWRWSPSPQGEWGQETTAIRVPCARPPARIPTGLLREVHPVPLALRALWAVSAPCSPG